MLVKMSLLVPRLGWRRRSQRGLCGFSTKRPRLAGGLSSFSEL
jgi:hypothetical protein